MPLTLYYFFITIVDRRSSTTRPHFLHIYRSIGGKLVNWMCFISLPQALHRYIPSYLQSVNFLDYVSALDNEDGNISNSIIILSDDVDINTAGEYSVVFQIKDSSNNSNTIELPVIVISETSEIAVEAIRQLRSQLKNPDSLIINSVYIGKADENYFNADDIYTKLNTYIPAYMLKVDASAENELGGSVNRIYYIYVIIKENNDRVYTVDNVNERSDTALLQEAFLERYWNEGCDGKNAESINTEMIMAAIDE